MLKLLIADDETDTSNAIRRTIPWIDYDILLCSEATNGKEAIEIIEAEHPDIALLDVRMPLLDGLGVVKYIHDKQLNVRTIILSGYDEFSYAQTALKYGVSDYLLKPCRMEDIISSINNCKKMLLQDLEQDKKVQEDLEGLWCDGQLAVLKKALTAAVELGTGLLEATEVVEPDPISPNESTSYSNLYHCDRDGVYLYIDMAMKQIAQAMGKDADDR